VGAVEHVEDRFDGVGWDAEAVVSDGVDNVVVVLDGGDSPRSG
jgi:hypothetical protein